MEDCATQKIWLRINVHFFLNDDCSGSLDPLNAENITPEQAYQKAESYIAAANTALDNNREQWNQVFWGVPFDDTDYCVPFRYLLTGVFVHCNTIAKNTSAGNLSYFQDNFAVDADIAYNLYVVEHDGGATGVAFLLSKVLSVENFDLGNMNHEMGHCFGLGHSWFPDGIADTPPIKHDYDFNGNGNLNESHAGVGPEKNRQCWKLIQTEEEKKIDYTGDGIVDILDACDPPPPLVRYPCCDWEYQNNNIMAYGSYVSCCFAFTLGQINRALQTLNIPEYCASIADITDCPPPAANLGILPFEKEKDDCVFTLHLESSIHDKYYKLEFFEILQGGSLQWVKTTGWLNGPAYSYGIPMNGGQQSGGVASDFIPGHIYLARLTVENECGIQSVKEITFTFPNLSCDPQSPRDLSFLGVTPNPVSATATVNWETVSSGDITILAAASSNTAAPQLLYSGQNMAAGTYSHVFSTANWQPGTYAVVALYKGQLYSINISKL